MYKVICHDDPTTTMEFVVGMLVRFFRKEVAEAMQLMMEVHNTGQALVAVLPFEQAEFRVDQVHSAARTVGYPLTMTYEPA